MGLPHLVPVNLSRVGLGRKRTTRPRGVAPSSPVRGFWAIPVVREDPDSAAIRRVPQPSFR